MNAKTCLATTGEGIARAELAPYGNWDVWAYGMRQAQYACLAKASLSQLQHERWHTRLKIRELASKKKMLAYLLAGILRMLGKMHANTKESASRACALQNTLHDVWAYEVRLR